MAPDGLPDPLRVAVAVAGILDRLGVAYVTAGSFASSLHGEPRRLTGIDSAGYTPYIDSDTATVNYY